MSEHEKELVKARNSVKKIERHLSDADAVFKKRENHSNELETLVKTQNGLAKTELSKVMKKA